MKTTRTAGWVFLTLVCLAVGMATSTASPPGLINYQGVLRNASGAPLTGSYNMVFTFFSDSSGGDQILIDTHSGGSQVSVLGGLFTTALGSGTVTDGSGPGTYTSLANAFRDYGTVYVEITVGGETLSRRIRVVSSAYSLNADNLDGLDSASFSLTSHDHSGVYLPLAGGQMGGNITFGGAQTVDGVDLSASAPNWNAAYTHSSATGNVHGLTYTAEGTGGGLDADLLDGQHASAFMGSGADNWVNTTGDTMTGKLTLATTSDMALSANVNSSSTLAWFQNAGPGYPLYAQTTYASATGSLVPAIVASSTGASTGGENVGVQGTGQGSATLNYGGKFFGLGNSGTKYGVYGYAGGAGENRAGYFWARQAGATTNYALYAEASGATNNYAGYFSGPVSVSGGKLTTASSSTSSAGLNLPHGTAPTTPSNGDLWTTTGGLYAQINGSPVGPFISSSISDHGALTGLGDDDHPQYFALSQSEAVTGIPAFNGGTSGATAPFTVSSTFVVANLNADLLDNQHASAFAVSGHGHSTLTRGTGLSGSNYDGTAPATFAVVYGTTPGTAVQGNQTATIIAGSGLTGGISADALGDGFSATLNVAGGNGIVAGANAVDLGPLTGDWNQTGAFDITLGNSASELRMLESTGASFYGTLDVGDLLASATYTFAGSSGTVLTTGNDGAGSTFDADLLDGQHGSYYLNTSSTAQTKAGKVAFNASSGDYGVEGYGPSAGGYFKDATESGIAQLGAGNYGITASGSAAGGTFGNSSAGIAEAKLGYYSGTSYYGVHALGDTAGGYFRDNNASGYAYAGYGDLGVDASGDSAGGHFVDSNSGSYSYVGYGSYGIEGHGGTSGAYFKCDDTGGRADAWIGRLLSGGYYGIRSFGDTSGGYFIDSNSTGYAFVGYGDLGIDARGNTAGGYFKDLNSTGEAYLAYGDLGIQGGGTYAGGVFANNDGTNNGYAYIGLKLNEAGIDNYYGVYGGGKYMGGYFSDLDESGWARVGWWQRGIHASGSDCGGYFLDSDSGGWAFVGVGGQKILGTGDCDFVQNHPYDKDRVIVYTSLEGDQVATFTRGSARLSNGEARVKLGETFKWVTNPDIGLTAHLTPVGQWADLYLVEKTTDEIVVRSRDPRSDARFDYIIYGLRIGYEEKSPIRERAPFGQASIPSQAEERMRYERLPELRPHNAMERFKAMRSDIGEPENPDLSRAAALKEAIHEFDPAVDHAPGADPGPRVALEASGQPAREAVTAIPTTRSGASAPAAMMGSDAEPRNRAGRNERVLSAMVPARAERFPVCEPVQEGDVLTNAPEHPGAFCLSKLTGDPGVVGIVVAEAAGSTRTRTESTYDTAPVATSGVTLCKADATLTPIVANDLLVASPIPGHAMKATKPIEPGTVIGKALEPLENGTGPIKVLVMLR